VKPGATSFHIGDNQEQRKGVLSRMFAGKLTEHLGSTKGALWMLTESNCTSTAAEETTKVPCDPV
jgi:hypothetical protein